MSKIIIIGNQKGGVGKSTVTSLVANYIHFKTDKKVVVVDADDGQRSLADLREMDIEDGYDEEKLYDLLKVNTKDYINAVKMLVEFYDIILVDLPGNLIQQGVMDVYLTADKILIPMSAEKLTIKSTVKFIDLIRTEINPLRKKTDTEPIDIKVFLNKVNARKLEFKEIMNNRENYNFEILEEYLPEYTLFSREATTANVYEHDNYMVKRFTKKMIEIINN